MERLVLRRLVMNSWGEELKARTRRFALDVIRLVRAMPYDAATESMKRQLVRAATGVSANYRSACRARSHAEFTARIGVVLEEADESEGWLDLFRQADANGSSELQRLLQESHELVWLFAAANRTARARTKRRSGLS